MPCLGCRPSHCGSCESTRWYCLRGRCSRCSCPSVTCLCLCSVRYSYRCVVLRRGEMLWGRLRINQHVQYMYTLVYCTIQYALVRTFRKQLACVGRSPVALPPQLSLHYNRRKRAAEGVLSPTHDRCHCSRDYGGLMSPGPFVRKVVEIGLATTYMYSISIVTTQAHLPLHTRYDCCTAYWIQQVIPVSFVLRLTGADFS